MTTHKSHFVFWIFFFIMFPISTFAAGNERNAEREWERSTSAVADFDRGLSLSDRRALKQSSRRDRERLTPRQRALYDERQRLKEEASYWDQVARLKADLLKMPGPSDEREAERIAETAIRGFADLREKYAMLRPALLHNLLVNMKVKGEGLCWEWTRDLTQKLAGLGLKNYDLLWASAREGTMREHNTAVVVSKGHPLEDGIFLDGWTKSGKPFWMRVPDDHKHPWKLGTYYGGGKL